MQQNYKVFLKNKSIILIDNFISDEKQNTNAIHYFTNDIKLSQAIDSFANNNSTDELYIVCKDTNKTFKRLFVIYSNIKASGGLIKNPENKILFIYRKNQWDLPKGKIDRFETKKHAAKREVREECGIKGFKITRKLPTTYHMYKIKNEWVIKSIYWYEMYYDKPNPPKPQIEEDITDIRWFKVNEINEALQNTYKSIYELVTNYLLKYK